ncbi:uncharacterized protein At1g76070-like [Musa acuminata AAA Group]|uniref:(wild Malaysian banana) hypothetical protein n=1 Tax=Musa acuminata subsp. malaccensis TaxID=214687 RepID=A0A804KE23_MUSAM|nr:PREDICTED: uncharacterized protein At1g76070 [Musa acuminata subsp. malaccensis]CAG1833598.1 unnamed protein product [Musa acuminata subsp. malaccensis]
MEKPRRSSIISFLPNRASFSHIPHHPYSPGRENPAKMRALQNKGFSGPMVSIVPMEARRKQKNRGGFETPEEPTSPKVTCMGQIKLRKMASRCKKPSPDRRERKPSFIIRKIFRRKGKAAASRGPDAGESGATRPTTRAAAAVPARAPLLGQTRRFASSRESLGDFDWRKVLEREDGGEGTYYAGDEGSDAEEDEVIIPHSAPIILGGMVAAVEPKKEVNLWKRRTLSPPLPLQLN